MHALPSAVLRRVLPLLACVLALASVLVPSGTARAAETTPLASRTGFSPGGAMPWLPDAELGRELDLMRSSGAVWLRVDFPWTVVERVRGTYDWRNLDRVVAAAQARGLKVLALPTYTPEWARPAGTTDRWAPSDPTAFAAFAAAAAARYVPQGVTAYEIWNEPNIANFWTPKPDVAAYARLLKASAAAIHAAAPGATVVTGGLSPAVDSADGSTIDPRTFVTRLYANGAGGSFDALGVHPYVGSALPSDTSTASWNTFQQMWAMQRTMAANGDGAKKIWMTETGNYTGTATGAVSEARQAEVVTDALRTIANLPWAGPIFFYSARDNGTDPTDREDNFGLVRRDFTPKPAWNALVAALRSTAAGITTSTATPTTAPSAPSTSLGVPTAPKPAPTATTVPTTTVPTTTAPSTTGTAKPAPTTTVTAKPVVRRRTLPSPTRRVFGPRIPVVTGS